MSMRKGAQETIPTLAVVLAGANAVQAVFLVVIMVRGIVVLLESRIIGAVSAISVRRVILMSVVVLAGRTAMMLIIPTGTASPTDRQRAATRITHTIGMVSAGSALRVIMSAAAVALSVLIPIIRIGSVSLMVRQRAVIRIILIFGMVSAGSALRVIMSAAVTASNARIQAIASHAITGKLSAAQAIILIIVAGLIAAGRAAISVTARFGAMVSGMHAVQPLTIPTASMAVCSAAPLTSLITEMAGAQNALLTSP
ncbi:hypothetical protein HYU15_03045 [Candidatus Woesearchaeota archaeon]|nr:hypothetical protein [Candidatus Woesearchaeota archaeon]